MTKKLACTIFLLLGCYFSVNMSAQCVKGNCLNGTGVYKFKSGAVYEGEFIKGLFNGRGKLKYSNGEYFEGQWKNQYKDGLGLMFYASGDKYEGYFSQNKRNGNGTMKFANKEVYAGNWANDLFNGFGKYTFPDGTRYEGIFLNGKYNEQGIMYYPDGSRYEGGWKNSKKHGNGILYYKDGTSMKGTWQNGDYVGDQQVVNSNTANSTNSQSTSSNNNSSSSNLKDCNNNYCNNEKGRYVYGDGSVYEGTFVNGQPEGKGLCKYSSGDKYVGGWSMHAPHGEGVMYYKSGKVYGAIWNFGEPVSEMYNTPSNSDGNNGSDEVKVDKNNEIKIWAVVVGVSLYPHVKPLRFTDDDAYQVYALLKSPEGGSLPDDQVKVLIDDNATLANIIKTTKEVLWKADENDVVLFYFSGHGIDGAFLPIDFDGYNNRLTHNELKSIFDKSKAKYKLCIADACHSGSLLASKGALSDQTIRLYDAFEHTNGGMALLMSSRREEESLEDYGLRSGIFSHFLVRGLKGEADINGNKIVTISEIYNYVYKNVRSYTQNAQTPVITGNYDSNMPVTLVRN
ncbi:MAG: caspase family protein [Saprospiraceae bacterium]|nr:caspase family protein [Saprospiraceae bacterium]